MAWVRLNIVAEGQTEETFVRELLAAHLAAYDIDARCRRVETGRRRSRIYRGGLVSYEKAKRDIQRWLRQDQGAYVTTMFDLYALPPSFPGYDEAARLTDPYDRVRRLEEAFAQDLDDSRFLPFIQLHEFEALLFSDIRKIDEVLTGLLTSRPCLRELKKIRDAFASPEEIDGGTDTAPSKRLLALFPGYDKHFFGPLLSAEIGLETMRRECAHFSEWITRLERLGAGDSVSEPG